jgi:anti-sigma factor RsiW
MSHVDDGALHAYLDGELPPVERAQLEAHVAECPACRTRLEEERALIERASGLLGLAQPVERPAPPMHQLRRPRLVWRLRVPIAWAASVVLAVGLGYYLGGTGYTPRQPEARVARITDSLATVSGSVREEPAAPPAVAKDSRPRAANQLATRRDEVVDRAAAEAAPESDAPPELRPVTPMPVPRAAVAAARPSAGLTSERGRLVAPEWPVIRPGPARDLLGADPVGIPGLTVRSIRRSPAGDVVLVEQALDSATVIQVFQERVEGARSLPNRDSSAKPQSAAPPLAARQRYAGTERLARFIGGLRVEIAGPLSADSLSRLLEQLKPIP